MENFDYMDISNKITCLIEIALKGEISSLNLDLLIDGLTPTLEKSRQIIRILLKEFEKHQLLQKVKKADSDFDFSEYFSEIVENQLTPDVVSGNSEDLVEVNEEKNLPIELTNLKSEENVNSNKPHIEISENNAVDIYDRLLKDKQQKASN